MNKRTTEARERKTSLFIFHYKSISYSHSPFIFSYFSPFSHRYFADLLSLSLFHPTGRYYRANSVRFPTQPCEGVCSLNHYCAITRIDYREYRQCLETAASALSSTTRSIKGDMNNKILLLLIAFIQLLLYQRVVLTQLVVGSQNIVKAFKTLVSHFHPRHLQLQQVC